MEIKRSLSISLSVQALLALLLTVNGKAEVIREIGVKAAYNHAYIFFRFAWKDRSQGKYPDYFVHEGERWIHDRNVMEDKLAVMLGNGKVEGFPRKGCYVVCHNDIKDQPNTPSMTQIRGHPYFGEQGLRAKKIGKYTRESRRAPGWAHLKGKQEIQGLRSEGRFLDLWQWGAHRSNLLGWLTDAHVLETKYEDSGKGGASLLSHSPLADEST